MFRFRMQTAMLWVVIVGLAVALIIHRESAGRREAALTMEHRETTFRLLVDLMGLHRERLVDKRQALQALTQEIGAGAEYEARLLRARRDLQLAEEAVVLSTKQIDDFARDGKIANPTGSNVASNSRVVKNGNKAVGAGPPK